MKKNPIVTFCTFVSIASIVMGFALMVLALAQDTTSDWPGVAAGFTPHAILVAGGLIALAICSSCGGSGDDD